MHARQIQRSLDGTSNGAGSTAEAVWWSWTGSCGMCSRQGYDAMPASEIETQPPQGLARPLHLLARPSQPHQPPPNPLPLIDIQIQYCTSRPRLVERDLSAVRTLGFGVDRPWPAHHSVGARIVGTDGGTRVMVLRILGWVEQIRWGIQVGILFFSHVFVSGADLLFPVDSRRLDSIEKSKHVRRQYIHDGDGV
jgi:hypothetical protein